VTLAQQAQQLTALAQRRGPKDREQLLSALISLFDDAAFAGDSDGPAIRFLIEDILLRLITEAETDIRARLAARLASKAWVPPALIRILALDEIEIARPIIASSPVLDDLTLIKVLVEATIEHQIEVARRPQLGAPVVNAILSQSEPTVLTALVSNQTTILTSEALAQLVEDSRRIAAMRAPLARHPQMNADLAQKLYVWVGQALRTSLMQRFQMNPLDLDPELAGAIRDAHGNQSQAQTPWLDLERDADRLEMEQKLVNKLNAAGQLRPSYLLRALREGQLSLFLHALGVLCGHSFKDMKRTVESPSPDLLALACWSVGMDRSVFPSVLDLVRDLSGSLPGGDGKRAIIVSFGALNPRDATAALRKALQDSQG
jgi:uncharacterized protein (DUF2336 family)